MKRTTIEEYNGWSNRETWAANLHMSNDYTWYHKARALIDEYDGQISRLTGRPYMLARRLEECFNDHLDDADMPFEFEVMVLRDVGSMWRIDWVEIAEGWLHR